MNFPLKVNSRYTLLSQNEIEMIHENSLRIMNEIGIVMPYGPAKELLAAKGCKVDGDRVYFPKNLVEECIKLAPSSYTLHGRNAARNVAMSTEYTAYAGPYGSPFVTDLDRGRRNATMDDFINIVKIVDNLKYVDIQSHISCEPQDVPEKERPMKMVFNTMKYSDKPLMGSIYGYENSRKCIELASIPFGGVDAIKDKPVLASIPCTLTPLSYDANQLGAIRAYAEYGQVQLINSLSIAGMTTPATIAGLVSVQNAEVLAGIVYAQCVNPGCPVVYSASGSNAEMSNGLLVIGTPEDAVVSLVNGQLAKYYQIPCRISGSLSDSKMMDAQAAMESTVTGLMAQMAGGNFILHAVGIIETYNTTSYEKLIIDNEMLGYARRLAQGVEVNEETLAFEAIQETGPQGVFLLHDHTIENFRDEFHFPTASLINRKPYDTWAEDGGLSMTEAANKKWKNILETYKEPALDPEVEKDMLKYIADNQ